MVLQVSKNIQNLYLTPTQPVAFSVWFEKLRYKISWYGGEIMTANQINYAKLREDRRHNVSTEKENARHNTATESQGISSLMEGARHNREQELINWYTYSGMPELRAAQASQATASSLVEPAKVTETARHNEEMEAIQRRGQWMQLAGHFVDLGGRALGTITDVVSIFQPSNRR